MKKHGLVVLLALLMGTFVTTLIAAAGAATGFKTAKPAYLVPTAPGVVVDPILSTGDIVGDYQMSGIPDGLGAYVARGGNKDDDDDADDKSSGTLVVVMNHELGRSFPNNPPGVDSRISRLEIDAKTRSVLDAEYLFNGTEGFERFCSATLMLIDGRPLFFTGEEAIPFANQPPGPAHDGSSIVLDPETGAFKETPHFGHLQHENVVPLKLKKKWVFLTSEDDFRTPTTNPAADVGSYLYAYIADNFNRAVRGRNGSLHVFKADNPAKNQNSTVLKNESVPGSFIPITQAENATSTTLKNAAIAKGAFRFDRLEDIAARPDVKGRTYVADTGKPPTTARGRVYQFDINTSDPTRATLKMILNGDGPNPDDIYNPDNMDASGKVLMIQEDRESPFRGPPGPPVADAGFNRVLVYDFDSKTLTSVARVATPTTLRPGTWESSGIIKAFDTIGPNWWLLDVQAHNSTAPQPGPPAPPLHHSPLVPNSSSGEDGQLLALYVPGTGGGGDDDDD